MDNTKYIVGYSTHLAIGYIVTATAQTRTLHAPNWKGYPGAYPRKLPAHFLTPHLLLAEA